MKTRKLLLAVALAGLISGGGWTDSAMADTHAAATVAPMGHGTGAHAGHTMSPAAPVGSTAAFVAANQRMHAGMDISFTGDADIDFALGMIPHHQGAIDMAKVMQAFGSDPALRKLAEDIIAAQEAEIAFLRDWLAARGR